MTPDEMVNKLAEILKFTAPLEPSEKQALYSAITQIQDYQKLRERVSVEKIRNLLTEMAHLGCCIYDKDCHENTDGAVAIVTYLQQPTEH